MSAPVTIFVEGSFTATHLCAEPEAHEHTWRVRAYFSVAPRTDARCYLAALDHLLGSWNGKALPASIEWNEEIAAAVGLLTNCVGVEVCRAHRCAVVGMKTFFIGVHQPSDASRVDAAFISVHRIARRVSPFAVGNWIMDSGAFSTILKFRGYPEAPEVYAAHIKRWSTNGNLLAAVTQDYMCEPHMLALTGKTVLEHQQLTVERYDAIHACDLGGIYLMPVLQGYEPADYVRHLKMYGDRLGADAWVGVGSVCKRNGHPSSIEAVLRAIKRERPDLRLHGFGIKTTALGSWLVRELLHTADSMAWSYAARKQGRNGNDIGEGIRFAERIRNMRTYYQADLFDVAA